MARRATSMGIGALMVAAALAACTSSDPMTPEVAEKTTAVEDAVEVMAVELSGYTATMMLAANDLYTLHAEAAAYGDRAGDHHLALFTALADVYACTPYDGQTDALDRMSDISMDMWQELAYHREWLPRIGEVTICKTEVRRHQQAMEGLLDDLFELQTQLEDQATGYDCAR